MPADDIDLSLGGHFTAWQVDSRWHLRMHRDSTEATIHAHSLIALHIAHPVFIGSFPDLTIRVAQCHLDLNSEGP